MPTAGRMQQKNAPASQTDPKLMHRNADAHHIGATVKRVPHPYHTPLQHTLSRHPFAVSCRLAVFYTDTQRVPPSNACP